MFENGDKDLPHVSSTSENWGTFFVSLKNKHKGQEKETSDTKEKVVDGTPHRVRRVGGANLMMKAPRISRSFRSLLNLLRRLIMNL